jgi:diguanylate cyclase (GGDEF)-like protein
MLNSESHWPTAKLRHPVVNSAAIEAYPANISVHGLDPGAADVAIGDWEILMSAVKARLRLSVGEPAELAQRQAVGAQVRTSVLECVAALDHLQAGLTHELARFRQLELDVFDVQTALAQTRTELAGTQAGEQRARQLALHDGLTLLPNRRYFCERLDQALAHAKAQGPGFAVLYLDLDGFKPINDTHGHEIGDALLRIIAARLAGAVRADDMMSRLGGDEFACLIGGTPNRAQLSQLAHKLCDTVAMPMKVGKLTLTVRISIGIALCCVDGASVETLLNRADAAMYQAKRQHSGHAFCD